jgi:hypothetical protein
LGGFFCAIYIYQSQVSMARGHLGSASSTIGIKSGGSCWQGVKAIIGVESNLMHISDDKIVWMVEQWKRLHPPKLLTRDEARRMADAKLPELLRGPRRLSEA